MAKKCFDESKNYKRLTGGGRVFTGKQLNALSKLARLENPALEVMIMLDTIPTEEEPTDPKSKYGV